MTNGQAFEVVEGAVTAVTASTVTVDGRKGTISKLPGKAVDPPAVGRRVRLELDARGFIHSLQPLEAEASGSANVHRGGRSAAEEIRVQVLVAAAAFGASRPDLKSGDVLKIADSWLAWVRADEEGGA